MTRPPTLFGHLMGWSLGALALLWLSFIAAGYQTGRHETDELVDGHLASVAALVAQGGRWGPAPLSVQESPATAPLQHEYQQSISLVVWDAEGRVLAHQGTAPLPAFSRETGFATLALGQPAQAWRSFARWSDSAPARRVMVLLNEDDRTELGWDIAGQVAAPGLWLLPALALGLGLALRRGLRPLQALSDDVRQLDAQHGHALPDVHPAQEFSAMVAAINSLVQRHQAALQRERELASELAHELRTPLSALVLQARSLREAPALADAAALQRLEQDALHAGQVLTELLALARASHTSLAEAAQPVDLAALAQRVLADSAGTAWDSGHELALVGDGPFVVSGHAVLLELALRNLVDNALAHTPPGTLIELRLQPGAGRLQVCSGPVAGEIESATGGPSAPGAAPARPGAAAGSPPRTLGLGLGHRVVAKVAGLHGAVFSEAAPPPGFARCDQLQFGTDAHAASTADGAPVSPPAP